jgi:hypothetical protein
MQLALLESVSAPWPDSDLWNLHPTQEYTSAATCRGNGTRLPALFRRIPFAARTRNLDLGGGPYDVVTAHLAAQNVRNLVFDPFNRNAAHNRVVAASVKASPCHTVTCANVLNVIREPQNRERLIAQAATALRPDGTAYFWIYAAAGGPHATGDDTWQEGRPPKTYLPEISQHFTHVAVRGQMLVATHQ